MPTIPVPIRQAGRLWGKCAYPQNKAMADFETMRKAGREVDILEISKRLDAQLDQAFQGGLDSIALSKSRKKR